MNISEAPTAISFDLFGTLVQVDAPADPAGAVATELTSRNISVPDSWPQTYAESHIDTANGEEVPLQHHVAAVLESQQGAIETDREVWRAEIDRAVTKAFDSDVCTRPGAIEAVEAARDNGPVGILSNCSLPGLARRSIRRSELSVDAFDAIVTSVECGWRKPNRRAFLSIADVLEVPASDLLHIGDDEHADGGASHVGARTVLTEEISLREFAELLRGSE